MNISIGLFILLQVLSCLGDENYTTKFDNIDFEEILRSDRLLENYINCLLDKGVCTPDGKELKRVLPDAMETGCGKCSPKQQEGTRKVIHFLAKEKREWFDALLAKYDPDNVYRKKYESQWKAEGLDLD